MNFDPQAFAAVMSAIATAFAAYATWQSPRAAARMAEKLRDENERRSESRQMRFHVFATLMQERASITSLDCVRMLNSIDVVFANNANVREAWAELYNALSREGSHPQFISEKIATLLRAMADDLGISSDLRTDDLTRVYYPSAIARANQIRQLQQEADLQRLQSISGDAAATPDEFSTKFPPIPKT